MVFLETSRFKETENLCYNSKISMFWEDLLRLHYSSCSSGVGQSIGSEPLSLPPVCGDVVLLLITIYSPQQFMKKNE